MSAMAAVLVWIAFGIALKLGLLAADKRYRRDYTRRLHASEPVARFMLIRRYPLRELGWYGAMAVSAFFFFGLVEPSR
jgi:hypothetical protein